MDTLRLLAGSTAFLSFVAWGQPASYEGTWTAKFETKRGTGRGGVVVIQGSGGTWDMEGGGRQTDPCTGRQAPILVQSATADELVFEVKRSTALAGCPDSTLTMKRVDEKTLQGAMRDGRSFTLTRKE
ncbi:MAG: hypothetical protein KKC85_02790 [Gammaproteobacteria bacterium]|nr:hypothetical protein [Gammaproteobacteria bacterium]MBU1442577.1 hypothetical protein [Gammaproteobacteria bacterium]MBU2285345.1 hypothetical protein [Gammaproteobacteria bacterium]